MTYPGWEICVKCSTRSSPWPGLVFGEWTSHARLVMTGSMLPVACGPLHCLFGEWCSAVKCWPSWQQFHCPFGWCLELVRPTPASQTGIQEAVEEEVEERGSDRGEELLAEHPGARPGLLPNGEKTSLLTSRSSRLCGDRDLSLHLKGEQHPIVICQQPRSQNSTENFANTYFYFFSHSIHSLWQPTLLWTCGLFYFIVFFYCISEYMCSAI